MATVEQLRARPPEFIDRGDLDGLREFAELHRAQIDADFELCWNTGWAFFRLGEHEPSIALLERSVELDPERAIGWWGLGSVRFYRDELDRAEDMFRRAFALRRSWAVRHSLAVVLLMTDRGEEGEKLLREGLAARPNDRVRITELADYLDDMGKPDQAEAVRATMERSDD